MAKLNATVIARMRKMKENNIPVAEIAMKFGVTKNAVVYHLDQNYQVRLKERVKKKTDDLYTNDENFRRYKRTVYKEFLRSHKMPRNKRYSTLLDVFFDLEDPEICLTTMELWGRYGSSYRSVTNLLASYRKRGFLIREERGKYRLNTGNFPAIKEFLERSEVKT